MLTKHIESELTCVQVLVEVVSKWMDVLGWVQFGPMTTDDDANSLSVTATLFNRQFHAIPCQ